jgi:hypothetical protein
LATDPSAGDLRAFLGELTEKTELIAAYAGHRISFDEFHSAYGQYYHQAALDGHEAGPVRNLPQALSDVARLHGLVQEVLDSIYEGPVQMPVEGRMTSSDAARDLTRRLAGRDVPTIVSELKESADGSR